MMRRLLVLFGLSLLGSIAASWAMPSRAMAQSWDPIGADAFVAIAGMSDGALVMIREPGDILRSTDLGATWHMVYHGISSLTALEIEHDTAFVYYDSIAVLISLDSGRTWASLAVPRVSTRVQQAHAYAAPQHTQAEACGLIRSVAQVDSVCYAVGEPGLIYVSDTSKTQWRRLHVAPFCSAEITSQWMIDHQPPLPSPLRFAGGGAGIDFFSAASGAIVRDSLVFFTHDSGTTWQEAHTGLRAVSAMLMISDTSALVGDTSGSLVIVSESTWRACDSLLGTKRPMVEFGWRNKFNSDIYVATDSALYLTTATFESVTTRAIPMRRGEYARSASFPDPYTCYVLADSVTRLDTTTLTDNVTHDTTIYSDTASIYQSTDGGATWTTTTSGLASLSRICFTSAKNGYACGGSGTLMFTVDSSLSWHRSYAPTRQDLHAIRFVNDSVGYAVGDSGTVLMTQIRGRWWRPVAPEPLFTHPGTSYRSLTFPDARHIYVLGADRGMGAGRSYRQTIREPMTGFRLSRRRTPQKNTLAITASPNPSNGTVHFTITSKQTSEDGASPTLVISDAAGRTIEQVQDLAASMTNTWVATADFSNLTTGAYTAIATLGGASGLCKFTIAH
ncbi:MAG: hypothetical protein Q8922_05775 [Bacteroidota bacterium]|nr:hypothetical protein [Bacteroidota bacterium]MDP4233087.1 hypothetical protein [Bacteroidota bacterium]MDP4241768.1 hypothetical protein [Bacteroidota bacterium]MDP4287426.1 hypothetical protein [Bacteroidota bacterium]